MQTYANPEFEKKKFSSQCEIKKCNSPLLSDLDIIVCLITVKFRFRKHAKQKDKNVRQNQN